MSINPKLFASSEVSDQGLQRRRIFKIVVAGLAASAMPSMKSAWANNPESRPLAGDLFIEDGLEGESVNITLSELRVHKPLVVYPFDASKKKAKDDTRLNRVVLLRMAPGEITEDMKQHAAGDVLAFSSICTHQGCDVKTWMSQEKVLACYCHGSKFQPLDGGKVVAGPAPRAMPILPIKMVGDKLAVAGDFLSPPGMQ